VTAERRSDSSWLVGLKDELLGGLSLLKTPFMSKLITRGSESYRAQTGQKPFVAISHGPGPFESYPGHSVARTQTNANQALHQLTVDVEVGKLPFKISGIPE
jgi:hypothetical protein